MQYIDIFAGCGGLSVGLQNAGWQGLFAVEKNKDAFSTLKYNLIDKGHHFNWPDWLDVKEHDIKKFLDENEEHLRELEGHVDLVAGGPPCQGFSLAGKRATGDSRNNLVKQYIRFVKLVKPKALIFENVHGFTVHFQSQKGRISQYSSYVINKLEELGYRTDSKIIDVSQYGVPQKRRRFILVAMLDADPSKVFSHLENNRRAFFRQKRIKKTTTIQDAIGDLEKANGTCQSPDTRNFLAGVSEAFFLRSLSSSKGRSSRFSRHKARRNRKPSG